MTFHSKKFNCMTMLTRSMYCLRANKISINQSPCPPILSFPSHPLLHLFTIPPILPSPFPSLTTPLIMRHFPYLLQYRSEVWTHFFSIFETAVVETGPVGFKMFDLASKCLDNIPKQSPEDVVPIILLLHPLQPLW